MIRRLLTRFIGRVILWYVTRRALRDYRRLCREEEERRATARHDALAHILRDIHRPPDHPDLSDASVNPDGKVIR